MLLDVELYAGRIFGGSTEDDFFIEEAAGTIIDIALRYTSAPVTFSVLLPSGYVDVIGSGGSVFGVVTTQVIRGTGSPEGAIVAALPSIYYTLETQPQVWVFLGTLGTNVGWQLILGTSTPTVSNDGLPGAVARGTGSPEGVVFGAVPTIYYTLTQPVAVWVFNGTYGTNVGWRQIIG